MVDYFAPVALVCASLVLVAKHWENSPTFLTYFYIFLIHFLRGLQSVKSLWVLAPGVLGFLAGKHKGFFVSQPPSASIDLWTRPRIYAAGTHHARHFPRKHQFSYNFYLVGVPIGRGSGFQSPMVGVDSPHWASPWFHVLSKDHLLRNNCDVSLRQKLDNFLSSRNVDPLRFPFVFLVTAPRFLGYAFNPASFWYLYSADRKLEAMIVEVNNTFDERRMYMLERSKQSDLSEKESESSKKLLTFTQRWAKDFHVSPFNDREGNYDIVASDPVCQNPSEKSEFGTLSAKITLRAPDNKAKLLATVYEVCPAKDALTMSLPQRMMFLAGWWWTGFATFPRILFEASRLYFLRKLKLWYRPEVRASSLPRQPTSSEIIIEHYFRLFLKDRVSKFSQPLHLEYTSSLPTPNEASSVEQRFQSDSCGDAAPTKLTFNVLTPFFMTHLVHFASVSKAIEACSNFAVDENVLLQTSNLASTVSLFESHNSQSTMDYFEVLSDSQRLAEDRNWEKLRSRREAAHRPPAQAYPISQEHIKAYSDPSPFPSSDLDLFVKATFGVDKATEYRAAVIETLESSAWGFSPSVVVKALIGWISKRWWFLTLLFLQVVAIRIGNRVLDHIFFMVQIFFSL